MFVVINILEPLNNLLILELQSMYLVNSVSLYLTTSLLESGVDLLYICRKCLLHVMQPIVYSLFIFSYILFLLVIITLNNAQEVSHVYEFCF